MDRIHLITAKKQFINVTQQLRSERLGVPGEYSSAFIPNFLFKQFKNKGRLVNMYDVSFVIPPHLLSKKLTKTPIHLVWTLSECMDNLQVILITLIVIKS